MKKKIIAIIFIMGMVLTGCNKAVFDTTYSYDRAIIKLADGTIVNTKIKSWNDYEGEQLQIVAEDGTEYLTNSFRCDLIKDK